MSQITKSDFSENAPFWENKEKKYALVIGVNTATCIPDLVPLKYAESDARGLGWLLDRAECNFAFPSSILTGAEASTQAVRQAVIHLLEQRSQDDLLLFYFIGHSYSILTSDENVENYLVTSDFDPEIAQHDSSAYLSMHWIRQMFFKHHKASIMIVLDCTDTGNLLGLAETKLRGQRQPIQTYIHPEQSEQSWAVLVSTEAQTSTYEVTDRRGEGHAHMTGLILDAFNGREPAALDSNGDVTLPSLYSYVYKRMLERESVLQRPHMWGSFPRHWVLAHQPTQNPVITTMQDVAFKSQDTEQQFFDEAICPTATFADLDIKQIRTFFQQERVWLQDDYRASLSESEQMEALGLLQGEQPTYAALLCFGRHPSQWITGAYTRCIYWKDTKRLSGWLDDREYRGSLLQQFTQALNFFRKHLNFSRVIERGGSSEGSEIPFRVLEEALANALVHREYVTEPDRMPRAEGVVVEIFGDRIEISSPGESLVTIESLQEASEQHPGSHTRNPQVLRIFYLANHVEQIGTGIEHIQEWLREASLPQPNIQLKQQDVDLSQDNIQSNQRTHTLTIVLPRPAMLPEQDTAHAIESKDAAQQHINLSVIPENSAPIVRTVSSTFVPNNYMLSPARSVPWFHQSHRLMLVVFSIVLIIVLSFGWVQIIQPHFGNSSLPVPPFGAASTTIEIASDFPTSGLFTSAGLPLQNGVQMAINEANHDSLLPGYTLKLVSYDDVGSGNRPDPLVGAHNVQQAIADNLVAGIVGPGNSTVAQKELPIVNQAPIALISPTATYPCLTKGSADDPACSGPTDIQAQMRPTSQLTYFRLATTDDHQGKAAADYFSTTMHYHKVLLLNDYSDIYSYGLSMAFQREWNTLGGQSLVQPFPEATSGIQDYQHMLQESEVTSFQPDLIYFAGNNPNGAYVLQALANIPALHNVAFAGGDGIMDAGFLQEAAQLHPNAPVYASLPIQDPLHVPAGIEFPSNYIASGYTNYRPYAASAYDCTMMLIQATKFALQKVSTPHGAQDTTGAQQFRTAIVQALAHLSYTGVTGTQSFDANGDTTNHTVSFYQLDLSKPQTAWRWLSQFSA